MTTPDHDPPFIHAHALCESPNIGPRTRVWAFAHILPGASIGADGNICDGVFIENDVVVGDRATVKCGVQLWDGVRLGHDVFVGPNATFTNDRFPRSGAHQAEVAVTVIDDGASLGANCTILPGIHVGRHAMVGAGAVVTRPVPPNAVVAGNPARIIGYVDADGRPRPPVESPADPSGSRPRTGSVAGATHDLGVGGATVHQLTSSVDLRGSLAASELVRDLGFPTVERIFFVYGVPNADVRGEHAHRACHQLLICAHGSVSVLVDDGNERAVVRLHSPTQALHIPPGVWGSQYAYSADAVLAVLASHPYDPDDYIRDYGEFLGSVGS